MEMIILVFYADNQQITKTLKTVNKYNIDIKSLCMDYITGLGLGQLGLRLGLSLGLRLKLGFRLVDVFNFFLGQRFRKLFCMSNFKAVVFNEIKFKRLKD